MLGIKLLIPLPLTKFQSLAKLLINPENEKLKKITLRSAVDKSALKL